MSRERYTPERIIGMLRQAEAALSPGQSVGPICRSLGVSEQSHCRRRTEHGSILTYQVRWLVHL